jgi:diguanylate cyclase
MSSTKHIGHQVIAMMDRLGISPITRNYHLFYVCIANSDPRIRQAVRNLGRFPTQHQLDQVIEEHCPEAVDSRLVRRHENAVLHAIDDLASRLQSEQSEMSGFQSAIERVSTALARSAEQDKLTTELLMKVVNAIGDAGNRRTASGQRTLQRMGESRNEVDALRDELVKVRRMANTDVLTGLANRRHFDDRLAAAFGKAQEFALILADIDHFKAVNDTHGHAFGDHVLKIVAATIAKSTRTGTFVARTGGEEFAVLVSTSNEREVRAIAERIREGVEQLIVRKGDAEIRFTVSLGAAISKPMAAAPQIYEAADAAMYRSKELGRNRVTMHDPSMEESNSNRYRIYAG